MASESHTYTISREVTGLFRMSKNDFPEAVEQIDAIWAELERAVGKINEIAAGKFADGSWTETNLKEIGQLAEGFFFSKLYQLGKEILDKTQPAADEEEISDQE